ncbi:hypothetical protein Tco_0508871 [Tanacetum coccineum]
MMQGNGLPNDWNSIINIMASKCQNRSIKSILCKIALGAAVYFVWQERSKRQFTSEKRTMKDLLEIILETIRLSLMSIKVLRSASVDFVAKEWDIKFRMIHQFALLLALYGLAHFVLEVARSQKKK